MYVLAENPEIEPQNLRFRDKAWDLVASHMEEGSCEACGRSGLKTGLVGIHGQRTKTYAKWQQLKQQGGKSGDNCRGTREG